MRHTPKTVLTALAATVVAATALTGCSGSTGDAGDGDETFTVAYFAPSLGIGYWQNVGFGVEQQANELGLEYVSYDADN